MGLDLYVIDVELCCNDGGVGVYHEKRINLFFIFGYKKNSERNVNEINSLKKPKHKIKGIQIPYLG